MKLAHVLSSVVVLASASVGLGASYTIDPIHSSAIFRIKHEVAYFYGRFDAPTGSISYDAANPAATTVNVTIEADKVNTGNPMRDGHVKSVTFLNAKEYPTLTFKSTSVKVGDKGVLEVTGDLTLHGITKSITVPLTMTGEGKGGQKQTTPVIGFEGTFTVNRSDFGMTQMIPMLGDDITFTVSFEGNG